VGSDFPSDAKDREVDFLIQHRLLLYRRCWPSWTDWQRFRRTNHWTRIAADCNK